jgi:hypothetical protein
MSATQVILSGGNFGGLLLDWPSGVNVVSIDDGGGQFWNYDIVMNPDDPLRADFVSCSNAPAGVVVTVAAA